MKSVVLSNEVKMPIIGLGTWKSNKNSVYTTIRWALKLGYNHIDTASIYNNEEEIGQALFDAMKEDNIKREDLFIVTKLWNNAHLKEDVKEAMDESLKKLRLDYVDLYLMHWPVAQKKESIMPLEDEDMLFISDAPIIDTWKEMEELYRLGKTKAIGVANFGVKRLEKLINEAEINPMVNQVESHPYLKQNELLEFLRNNNIVMTAYAPIGSGDKKIVEDKIIKEIAQKNNVSEYQVCLAWNINRGVVVIPKSENVEHLRENLGALNVMLDEGDMKKIDDIDIKERVLTADVFKIGPYKDEDIFA